MTYYKLVNKNTGETPTRSNHRMNWDELMDVVNGFLAFNPYSKVQTDEQRLAYYKKKSFYHVVETQ